MFVWRQTFCTSLGAVVLYFDNVLRVFGPSLTFGIFPRKRLVLYISALFFLSFRLLTPVTLV